ncbi:BTB domain-containing protein [Haematococcus lacustris]|uniref:BTB domain-containing protein n=1 Tax=Haematococcus lacustris TaxID=44745 RepID=A0A699YUI5_HAELA|nr:BTB domain-containing protein [Haematococcus lacustris]
MAQCVLKDVIAHPSVTQGGGLTLECDDGELLVMRNVFAVSSLLIADLVGDGCSLVKVSGSTKEEWLLVISQLYPIVPRPELSLQQLQQVLPVVHKYNFPELLQYVSGRLVTELPSTWSLKPADPGYIINVAQGGGLTLDCDDGELSVLRDVFAVSSPLMADLLSTGCTLVKVSGSTKEEWLLVISQLYPIIPHPELSLPQLQQVLPVVHKYNFLELLQYVNGRLVTELPSCWSLNPSAPGYIIKWLVMAEQLQLDALKQAALEGLKKQPPNQIKGQMAAKAHHLLYCLQGKVAV